MRYEDFTFKIPVESDTYRIDSDFITGQIMAILDEQKLSGSNKILININKNLKSCLPLKDINKIAGPLIETWAFEKDIEDNKYSLINANAEAQERLDMSDIILQFRKNENVITGNLDVKTTSDDIPGSGKSPNLTSFSRIRTAYVKDPDFMFIILSLRHRNYSQRNSVTNLIDGVMEITDYTAYDLKYISEEDINYNPALGTGQIQVKDIHIHYVSLQYRTTWEMGQLLDKKFLHSSRRTIEDFYREARKTNGSKNNCRMR